MRYHGFGQSDYFTKMCGCNPGEAAYRDSGPGCLMLIRTFGKQQCPMKRRVRENQAMVSGEEAGL